MRSAVQCAHCGTWRLKENRDITRASKAGRALYCDRQCAGLGRRIERSLEEKRALKAAYDAERRVLLADKIKAAKAARHKATYDPVKAAAERKLKMPRHVEYCRRPEYRAWKAEYDRKFRAKKEFGPFWEASLLLLDLQSEVLTRASRYELDLQNGTLNKKQLRRRDYDHQTVRR